MSADREKLLAAAQNARSASRPLLLVWPLGRTHWAWFVTGHGCPCLECFEILNPKMFARRRPSRTERIPEGFVRDLTAYQAGRSAGPGRLRISGNGGSVSDHPVHPVLKCPARLRDEGFRITP